ncbi:uncharacterized protein LOC129043571 [Pongo pygmaeus]|uniref:uncharacterized protein LOC129043571 n=1 Tax=Pongo pygmaeus TaxID=9600 RepID=UPI0023E2DA54|nr:uncharacterized protein LOC129043571 [Pongo pygmaeus]
MGKRKEPDILPPWRNDLTLGSNSSLLLIYAKGKESASFLVYIEFLEGEKALASLVELATDVGKELEDGGLWPANERGVGEGEEKSKRAEEKSLVAAGRERRLGGFLPGGRASLVHSRGPWDDPSQGPSLSLRSQGWSQAVLAALARALSAPPTLGGATGTSSRPEARSQPGSTRRGAVEISGFSRKGRWGPGRGGGGRPLLGAARSGCPGAAASGGPAVLHPWRRAGGRVRGASPPQGPQTARGFPLPSRESSSPIPGCISIYPSPISFAHPGSLAPLGSPFPSPGPLSRSRLLCPGLRRGLTPGRWFRPDLGSLVTPRLLPLPVSGEPGIKPCAFLFFLLGAESTLPVCQGISSETPDTATPSHWHGPICGSKSISSLLVKVSPVCKDSHCHCRRGTGTPKGETGHPCTLFPILVQHHPQMARSSRDLTSPWDWSPHSSVDRDSCWDPLRASRPFFQLGL